MSSGMPSNSLLENVTKLNGENWISWISQIKKILIAIDADEVITGDEKEPNDADGKKDWKRRNKKAGLVMWSCIEPQWQYLVEDEPTGTGAYTKLKTKFEASNFSRRVALRKAFYGAEHDPSLPVEVFVQSVLKARAQLVLVGVEIDDVAAKDVILMNLDSSYATVKTSLLTQPSEPTLETIRTILSSSSNFVDPEISPTITIKSEPGETALAARFNKRHESSKQRNSHSSHGSSATPHRESSGGEGKKDSQGLTWCDSTNDSHCHRCGRTGHYALRCVRDMPPEIKAWLRGESESRNEQSMWVRSRTSSRSRSPPLSHSNSPSPRHVSFHARSHSGSRSPSPVYSIHPSDDDSDHNNSI